MSLAVGLASAEDISTRLKARRDWCFVFGRHHEGWVDAVDRLVTGPTATLIGIGWPMTFIEKHRLPERKLRRFFRQGKLNVELTGQDIFFLTDTAAEALEMMLFVQAFAPPRAVVN